jgi:GNAT superfamily N-acetyltransferase
MAAAKRYFMRNESTARDLTVRPPQDREEAQLAHDLIAQGHAESDSAGLWFADWGKGYPGFAPNHTRVAFWRGELAGALRIHSETMRLGEARLKMGGLGWITTTDRHRGKGVTRSLLVDALNYLQSNRYHLAMLFGSPNVYYPLGFVTALPDYAITTETLEAIKMENPYRLRRFKAGDLRVVQRIHDDNDSAVACSILRNSGHFANKAKETATAYVLADHDGRVVAYFFVEDCGGYLAVEEAGVREQIHCGAVLSACGEIAAELSLGTIQFRVPPPHSFARFMLDFPSSHERIVVSDGGGMLALTDLGETLESLVPEWESLLHASPLRDRYVEVTIHADGESFRIRGNRGAVDCSAANGANRISLNERELIQLITGYRRADDLFESRRTFMAPEAREFLTVLFPERNPYVWPFDRF